MANYNNTRFTYAQVMAGHGYYMKDDQLRYSADVRTMQAKLNMAGYGCGVPDGKFGKYTDASIRKFQQIQGLKVDGKAGKDTLTRLDKVLDKRECCTKDADIMRTNIVNESAYWIGRIPYCIDNKVSTQVLDKQHPPKYMDCSDFTSSVYLTVLGINIGVNTTAQIGKGTAVPPESMKPGDLILFDWNGNGMPNHVGICSGPWEMIHEHGTNSIPDHLRFNQNVERKSLTSYYIDHILAVRRIIQDNGDIIN